MKAAYSVEGMEGIYYSGKWIMFQTQLLAFLVVTTWVCINMIPFFALLKVRRGARAPGRGRGLWPGATHADRPARERSLQRTTRPNLFPSFATSGSPHLALAFRRSP